jgi:Uma2 family endonuclease
MSAMVANPATEMTLDQWAAMDEDEEGELVDGVLVEEEVAGSEHEVIVGWLIYVLRGWLANRGGFVLGSDAKFAVRPRRGRKPDLSVYFPRRTPGRTRKAIDVPPDVAIEIVSPEARDQRRDRVEKVIDYAAFGVRWYWLVDPALRTVEILELGADGRYAHATSATDERLDVVPGCDGLVLDVPALWAEIDRLERDQEA